jgi:hypothetical protein
MPRRLVAWIVGLAPALAACGAGWHRVDDLTPRQLPIRQQVQLWMGQHSRVLHAVTLESHSIGGVPFHLPPECDSCRVLFVRSTVDSMRFGSRERGFLRSVGLTYIALGLVGLYLYFTVDTD